MNNRKLMVSILSLSLLTVMAGAAVAPALGVIKAYFADSNQLLVQMVISTPAVFIVIVNFIFPRLCRHFGSRTIVVAGLIMYTVGGCAAGLFSNIGMVLVMRAFVGIGVGMIMPMSTGLLTFYFPPEEHERLMGLSSAMNQMGGVAATLLAGVLAGISWRASFLVYLMGLFSIVLCIAFLPDDMIHKDDDDMQNEKGHTTDEKGEVVMETETVLSCEEQPHISKGQSVFRKNFIYIAAMFLLMTTFFIYPANFAIQTAADGIIPQGYVAVIMAMMDFVAFAGGLMFVTMKKLLKNNMRFLAPVLFLAGYILLIFPGGWAGTLLGSVFIGFANGIGIPLIISEASSRAGKTAAVTVMPLISAALYLAQFLCPAIMSVVTAAVGGAAHLPYITASVSAVILIICSAFMPVRKKSTAAPEVSSEAAASDLR